MSNSNMKLDAAALSEKLTQFEEIDQEMERLVYSLEKGIDDLVPYWNTKASELEYAEFKTFFTQLHAITNLNKTYSSFLKNTVISSHEDLNKRIGQVVDDSLDVRG